MKPAVVCSTPLGWPVDPEVYSCSMGGVRVSVSTHTNCAKPTGQSQWREQPSACLEQQALGPVPSHLAPHLVHAWHVMNMHTTSGQVVKEIEANSATGQP